MPKLTELVQALLAPKCYPEAPKTVELVQTQMSCAFVTDDYVYKVKKPVNLGYLDYSTLEQRRFYCQKEVELNRRLCPAVYLGVVPITQDEGAIIVDGKGEVIEYSVKMRRLPTEAMMDVMLAKNLVMPDMVTRVAQKLVEFHRNAETSADISTFGSLNAITQNTDENFIQTEKYIGIAITDKRYQQIKDYTDSFIEKNSPLFQKRVADGKIRDCHGDLHTAHVCFSNDIYIYDCIEFNDRFRYCDVASEISFLAMDLDHFGWADLSRSFVDAYVEKSQDRELLELLNFYKCYRAYVRGKVACFKFDDSHISEEEKAEALTSAKSYFELAESYTRNLEA